MKKLQNIWYHYKSIIIVGAALLTVAVIMAVNFFTKKDADLSVIFFTETAMFDHDIDALEKSFESKIGDINGDGEIVVTINNIVYNDGTVNTTYQEQMLLEMTQGETAMIFAEEGIMRELLRYGDAVINLENSFNTTYYDGRAIKIITSDLFDCKLYHISPEYYVLFREYRVSQKQIDESMAIFK